MDEKIKQLKEHLKLLETTEDNEFRQLINDEIESISSEILDSDPVDQKNAFIEIRAGTGGDEAELFAAELSRMYIKYCEKKGFKTTITSQKDSSLNGIKEIIISVEGSGAYGLLKYEGGVHRVQRVPKTEKSGRLHTSAATVAVMPEVEDKQIEIRPEDIRVDVYRSSGHGGQSVNTTDSAVRITHLPTGIVVTCQDEKSQIKNKEKALKVLRGRLWQAKEQERQAKEREMRLSMVGSGDRSEKIRTYNYPQDRITDHRINKSFGYIEKILNGDLDQIIVELKAADREDRLKVLLEQKD